MCFTHTVLRARQYSSKTILDMQREKKPPNVGANRMAILDAMIMKNHVFYWWLQCSRYSLQAMRWFGVVRCRWMVGLNASPDWHNHHLIQNDVRLVYAQLQSTIFSFEFVSDVHFWSEEVFYIKPDLVLVNKIT